MLKNGQIETFKRYSQFQSVTEFNLHMKGWLQGEGRKFSKGEKIALTYLTRYAVKVVGVANVKIGTVLKTIHTDYNGNGISRSTWKRMVVKAKKLGMIVTHELARENGSQSSNLYVFMRYPDAIAPAPEDEPPKPQKLDHHNQTIIKKTQIIINKKNRKDELDYTFTSDKVPLPFVKLVKVFYDNAAKIEEFWRMAEIAAYKYVFESDTALKLDIAIAAFKQMIRKLKMGTVKKAVAYYYKIALNKFADAFQRQLDEIVFSGEVGTKYPRSRSLPATTRNLTNFIEWLK